ncbi:uncharacterized protein LOC132285725 isoform X2 [Cornus florida]|uniref:uncharacterized protein LOC132285725 isoform X2 n=1 Tax=Cornus florida TaxID=4283 RepID=UPI00289CD9D7|nr:uncharacterized protein LOC132285725 isoform X2 [Cornus florida]
MSAYETVVAEKLKLKGKALHVKADGIKKKKKHSKHYGHLSQVTGNDLLTVGNTGLSTDQSEDDMKYGGEGQAAKYDDHLTPAEKRYLQQWEKIDIKRLAKTTRKSHRDRIQEFNQYLANLSEHYDIPKVGPG